MREKIWHQMLSIHSSEVFTIGLISGTLQPVVVSKRLQNVPSEGIYNWNLARTLDFMSQTLFGLHEKSK